MDARIEKMAEELGAMLADSEEAKRLKDARAELEQHGAAQIMLRDLQQKQERLQRKQLAGEEITQAEIDDLQRVSQIAAMNPYVRGLLQAEIAFSEMMANVQRIMFKAAGIVVPEGEEGEAGVDDAAGKEAQEQEEARKARSKLWLPGQR